ncbi:MAG: peptide ABC transporter substrate-binding protein [Thermomicrobiales bacterium]
MATVWKPSRRQWGRVTSFALLSLIIPAVLAACGGSATSTPAPAATKAAATTGAAPTTAAGAPTTAAAAATTAPAAATASTSGTAASAATKPAASTTASGTTAASSTTAGTTTASTGPDPRGVGPTKRGGGGTLHLLWWQAPVILNDHLANGTKDEDASRVIEEPLAVTSLTSTLPDVPVLAKSIPSAAAGSVAADGKSVTWTLKDGVKWSDGTPFTSADVKATWQFVIKVENGASDLAQYDNIATIDTPDATTVKISFKVATANWYTPFTNLQGVVLQKAQIDTCTDPTTCVISNAPIGTGPYKLKSFTSGDNVQYVMNDNYRDPNAPFFDAVDLKGGGDAGTAAKAVQTGQVDYAWNLQVTPDITKQVRDAGKVLDQIPGSGVEQLILNQTDPNKDVNGEKSSLAAPHPFLTDPKVREAISWLVDRDNIAKSLYDGAKPTCNILLGIPAALQSTTNKCGYDVAKANQILDDAGWKKGSDGVRAKNGVQMKVVFETSVNSVREKEEQVMKQSFQQAGITMDIKNADAGVFFGQPDNPDAAQRADGKDLIMYTTGPQDPDAGDFLLNYQSKFIPQKANGWKNGSPGRWKNDQYDQLAGQLAIELNPEKRSVIEKQLNDIIVTNYFQIPIVDRYSNNGHAKELLNTNPTPWDSSMWNIAYWKK